MKAAMAMEKAAESPGDAGSGMGMGLGLMMPAMFAEMFRPRDGAPAGTIPKEITCSDCGHRVSADSRFCPVCGHQQIILDQCVNCGKNLKPNARFCPKCGHSADEKPVSRICPKCRGENMPVSIFCNQCGEMLE